MHDILPRCSEPVPRHAGAEMQVLPDRRWALFLDVDGTLLHLEEHPDAVEVSDHLRSILKTLEEIFDGAVALVSGRRIEDLDRLFAPIRLRAAGLHGLELRDGEDGMRVIGDPAALDPLRRPLRDFSEANEGLLLEDKDRALALHYRKAPHLAEECRALVRRLTAGRESDLRVIDGKMVLEIKPRLSNKGLAVSDLMKTPPFRGRKPVFIGDDVTDEDGFLVVNALGGYSIRVGNKTGSSARYQLNDVVAVIDWLESLPGRIEVDEPERKG